MKTRILSLIALVLAILLSLSLFAACKKTPKTQEENKQNQEQQQNEQTPNNETENQDETNTDPDNVDAEGHQLPKPTLSVARLQGTYTLSGTFNWDDFKDDAKDETDEISFSMSIFPSGENLSITIVKSDEDPSLEYTITDYDPQTGTCSFTDESEIPMTVTFSEDAGIISVTMQFDNTSEGGRVYGSYTGQKK